MSQQNQVRDRCPKCNIRLAKLYHKKVAERHFTAYVTPKGNEVMRCPVHGLYTRNDDGVIQAVKA